VRRAVVSVALAAALAMAHATNAGAQPASPQPEEEESAEEASPPPASSASGKGSPMALRLALVGDYRKLLDLSELGAGVAVSYACACDKAGGSVDLRVTGGRTLRGLSVTEVELGGSAEFKLVGGLLAGLGGGLTFFGVERATNKDEIMSVGPELFGRLGYRFGTRAAPYVTLDLGAQLQAGWTIVWGPTLAVGYRF
jgi:hypothetical protein